MAQLLTQNFSTDVLFFDQSYFFPGPRSKDSSPPSVLFKTNNSQEARIEPVTAKTWVSVLGIFSLTFDMDIMLASEVLNLLR